MLFKEGKRVKPLQFGRDSSPPLERIVTTLDRKVHLRTE